MKCFSCGVKCVRFVWQMDSKNGALWGKNKKFSIVDTSLLDGKIVELRSLPEECEKMEKDLVESKEREELKSLLRRALELTAPTTKQTKANQFSQESPNMLSLRHHSPEKPRGELLIDLNLPPPADSEDDDAVQDTKMQGKL